MKTVAICIPVKDGRLCWETMMRLRIEEYLLGKAGWRVEYSFVPGCSLPHIARNDCVHDALHNIKADVVMFVDDDMDWESGQDGAIVRLLAHDKDVVAAACPRKVTPIQWNVKWAANETTRDPVTGLMEVATVGTAFMAIKRGAFVKLAAALPHEYHYERDLAPQEGTNRKRVAFFESPTSWGEDSRFCHLWRSIGGKVWIDPTITMSHIIAPNWAVKGQMLAWLEEQRKAAA